MTACCQITCAIPWFSCEQLPYPPKYPRISQMRQRDKSDLPLLDLSYKYFLLRYSFSISSFYSQKSTFLAAAPPEDSKNFNKGLLQQSPKSSIFFLARKWPSTSSFLRLVYHPSFSALLLYSCSSAIPFTEYSYFFLFFLVSSITFRIWPIRS